MAAQSGLGRCPVKVRLVLWPERFIRPLQPLLFRTVAKPLKRPKPSDAKPNQP